MIDVQEMFERQARWQHSRARLSWMEKLRMAETLRLAAQMMAKGRTSASLRAGLEFEGSQHDEGGPAGPSERT